VRGRRNVDVKGRRGRGRGVMKLMERIGKNREEGCFDRDMSDLRVRGLFSDKEFLVREGLKEGRERYGVGGGKCGELLGEGVGVILV
jgi:hypothetical protein